MNHAYFDQQLAVSSSGGASMLMSGVQSNFAQVFQFESPFRQARSKTTRRNANGDGIVMAGSRGGRSPDPDPPEEKKGFFSFLNKKEEVVPEPEPDPPKKGFFNFGGRKQEVAPEPEPPEEKNSFLGFSFGKEVEVASTQQQQAPEEEQPLDKMKEFFGFKKDGEETENPI